MTAVYGRKTYMGGLALIFLAIGSVLQGFSDGSDIDWNTVIAEFTMGASVLGAAHKADSSKTAAAPQIQPAAPPGPPSPVQPSPAQPAS